jgi:uncharacterized lipoprotein YajG
MNSRNFLAALFLVAVLLLTGCAIRVPANTVRFQTPRGTLELVHPQNTKAKDIALQVSTNGQYSLSIGSLDTQNNPEVIDKTAAGQVAIIKAQGEVSEKLFRAGVESIGAAGGKAVGAAAK